jgi:hypothetical protein
MKSNQDLVSIIKAKAETVIEYFFIQTRHFVRLISKKPKRPVLSWEKIIEECFPDKPHVHVSEHALPKQNLPEVNQQLALIPLEIFAELLSKIQKNSLDEIQIIRLYEKLCRSDVLIVRGHVHFYQSTTDKGVETIDYETLKNRVLEKFIQHKQLLDKH